MSESAHSSLPLCVMCGGRAHLAPGVPCSSCGRTSHDMTMAELAQSSHWSVATVEAVAAVNANAEPPRRRFALSSKLTKGQMVLRPVSETPSYETYRQRWVETGDLGALAAMTNCPLPEA